MLRASSTSMNTPALQPPRGSVGVRHTCFHHSAPCSYAVPAVYRAQCETRLGKQLDATQTRGPGQHRAEDTQLTLAADGAPVPPSWPRAGSHPEPRGSGCPRAALCDRRRVLLQPWGPRSSFCPRGSLLASFKCAVRARPASWTISGFPPCPTGTLGVCGG